MSKVSLKEQTTKGVFWSSVERFSVQGIQFVVMLVMARLLSPEDYGVVGMLAVFVSLAQAFVDGGFSQALIRKKDRTEVDNSTVFYFNIVVSVTIYVCLYISAPLISRFYEMPSLTPYTRVICLSIIINSLSIVQRAIYSAKIDFKTQTKASIISVIISGIVGVYLAYKGFGPWALVWQQISNLGINTFFLWIYSSWRPIRSFSWKSFNELFGFGSKLLATSILNSIYSNVYTIVIGKMFSASSLGYYTRAEHFANLPSSNFTSVFQRVTFPILCKVQDDLPRLENIYRRLLRASTFVIFPCMIGLAAVAEPMISILLGDKWETTAYLLRILCFGLMWYPMHAINLDILQVKGRSDLFLKLEIYKKIIAIIILFIAAPFGLEALCYSKIVSSLICLYINNIYTSKILGVTIWSQFKDIIHTLFLNLSMYILITVTISFIANMYIKFSVGICVGIVFYICVAKLYRFPEFNELKTIVAK